MDLAKIRKKSLAAIESLQDVWPADSLEPFAIPSVSEAPAADKIDDDIDLFQLVPEVPLVPDASPSWAVEASANTPRSVRDPIEIIMAGRSAAGCDLEAGDVEEEKVSAAVSDLEFLSIRVSGELYGINIMDIKEIIKPREVTEVPRAPSFVTGVLSLRGTIIPVIDMRLRLGLVRAIETGKERIVVIKNNESFSGLLVDEVIQVVRVKKDSMESAPAVLDGIDREFVNGLGRSAGQLLIVLNLEKVADIHLY